MIRPKAEYRIFSEIREKSGEQVGEFNTTKQVHMTLARQVTYNKDPSDRRSVFIFENTFSIF